MRIQFYPSTFPSADRRFVDIIFMLEVNHQRWRTRAVSLMMREEFVVSIQ